MQTHDIVSCSVSSSRLLHLRHIVSDGYAGFRQQTATCASAKQNKQASQQGDLVMIQRGLMATSADKVSGLSKLTD